MNKKYIVLAILGLFLLTSSLYLFIENNTYKKILFFDYTFENTEIVNDELLKLGFRYKMNFAECPSKKIFFDNIDVQNFSYKDERCIILYSESKNSTKQIKRILNKKTQARFELIYLPDDFYKYELSHISTWDFDDRTISLFENGNTSKIYIKEAHR
ncbi:MAG: hypothetical protein IK002_08575 [Treponema sp.]|uniref:hypothetical protein n=1 Tax=Treponema sp. TaxID=166 RepID=UPI00298E6448|nr:hypothetical protein [Treponema sp.]MBR5934023.1 hypothetical protein [Treponema sp.]